MNSAMRRGTGPRTVQGKQKSRQNAVKHGIFSKAVVLPGEPQAEFNALLGGLRTVFQPVGMFEDDLVEMLAVTRWRQRRLLLAEGAEIQAGREFNEWDLKQKHLDEAAKFAIVQSNGGLIAKISNPEALETCLGVLRRLKFNVEANGLNCNDNAMSLLSRVYGAFDETHWGNTLFRSYVVYSTTASYPEDVRKNGDYPSPEECKSNFLRELEIEETRLVAYQLRQLDVEAKKLILESVRRSVPDSPRLDQLLRYGITLERTFDRTLSQLERAQRMRLGELVVSPLSVNVTS